MKFITMQIFIIVALADNYVIGINNRLPWRLPADLKHFRDLTYGKNIVMGRKTYESIGKALPGRRNIVLSKNKNFRCDQCEVYDSLEKVFSVLKHKEEEIFIIGGTEIYKEALLFATKMYLTFVHAHFNGDAYFPKWNDDEWREIERRDFIADKKNIYNYSFVVLERVSNFSL
jgi:dihydrofolate reductase